MTYKKHEAIIVTGHDKLMHNFSLAYNVAREIFSDKLFLVTMNICTNNDYNNFCIFPGENNEEKINKFLEWIRPNPYISWVYIEYGNGHSKILESN